MIDWRPIIKIVCLTIIGAPPIIAAAQGVEIPPVVMVLLAVAAMAAGHIMGEVQPGWRGGTAEDLDAADDALARRVADEIEFRIRSAKIEDELISKPPTWLPPEGRG